MKFTSILGNTPYHLKPSEVLYPSYFDDLNLDQVMNAVLAGQEDYQLERYFYYPAFSETEVIYRKEIFSELSNNDSIRSAFFSFSESMRNSRKYMGYRENLLQSADTISSKTAAEIKRRHFLFDAAKYYCEAVTGLSNALAQETLQSEGIRSLFAFLQEYGKQSEFCSLQDQVLELDVSLKKLTFRMELSGNKLTIQEDYQDFDVKEEMRKRCGFPLSSKKSEMKSPFTNLLELEDFEGLILSMLKQPYKDIFKKLESFENFSSQFYEPLLLELEEEIQVYLSAHKFIDAMAANGFSFSVPSLARKEMAESPPFLLKDVYDLALACKHVSPANIIVNTAELFPKEHFFVITGPNQGGKTTFARAVGQALYFHQMGFPVAGTFSCLPVFATIFTHFLNDEDVQSGAGKLKEELKRLEPMLHCEEQNGFVILNELFTTATTYDAEIMGKQILQAFMSKNFCGIYVTHIRELAQERDGIVSLTALVDSDEKTRTYHLARAKAKGLAYAQTIAGAYRLSKEDILNRVKSNTPQQATRHDLAYF